MLKSFEHCQSVWLPQCAQVVELVGLAAGLLEGVPLEAVPSRLEYMAAHVQQRQPGLLREIRRTQGLTDEQREVRLMPFIAWASKVLFFQAAGART